MHREGDHQQKISLLNGRFYSSLILWDIGDENKILSVLLILEIQKLLISSEFLLSVYKQITSFK